MDRKDAPSLHAELASGRTGGPARAALQEGWVIANHILVSFHVAFISSVLALPPEAVSKAQVLAFIFVSPETLVSALFMYTSFHAGIALHELGHFLTAARLSALNDEAQAVAAARLSRSAVRRWLYLLTLFVQIPWGRAVGVKRVGLNYYPDAPYNLAVAAAGPRASYNVALVVLLPAVLLLSFGLGFGQPIAIYAGRLLLGVGVVCLLDFLLADPGKYKAFQERERRAELKAANVVREGAWAERSAQAKRELVAGRLQQAIHPDLGPVTAPWQFRNCGMGGRHTEKEYPESNISMQEAMFLILRARDYSDAQELTVRLQNRLKEIIEGEEGCRVMGIGLEGGLAPYIERGTFALPEVRLWSLMKRAIEQVGCRPGIDVAIALDPAMSELEIAYRRELNVPDSVGMYLFWRDKALTVLDRDGVLALYVDAIETHDIPILSIEDGFSEDDDEGWKRLLSRLGDRCLVIGDDLVTTNDRTIERAAEAGLINAALIKANQIGTLTETLLAMLVALGKGMELVVSHRSKSPNDDMEGQIALAVNALGLKAGGGANTERLVKYQTVTELMLRVTDTERPGALREDEHALIHSIRAWEEPTNAGIPTVGASVEVRLPQSGAVIRTRGATPLGTSAGAGEAIHLVDSMVERSEHREVIDTFLPLFEKVEPGVFRFARGVEDAQIRSAGDASLTTLYKRAQRYEGKGCITASENVVKIVAPHFAGRNVMGLSLNAIDRALLELEVSTAERRGKVDDPGVEARIAIMQRKANLGMNAVLSVSLALARALAAVRGMELYELLRREMLELIDRLAARCDVQLAGNRMEDYIDALRRANRVLEEQGGSLHRALRSLSGVYGTDTDLQPVLRAARVEHRVAAVAGDGEESPAVHPDVMLPTRPWPGTHRPEEVDAPPPILRSGLPVDEGVPALDAHAELIGVLNRALHQSFGLCEATDDGGGALRTYAETKMRIAPGGGFGIANNRVFRNADGRLLVPYLVGDALVLQVLDGEGAEIRKIRRFPAGFIYTDAQLLELAGFAGEVVDLERRIFLFDPDEIERVHIGRIRDMAELLQRVNRSSNRNLAVYYLRTLLARLCSASVRAFLGAKNLQPEVAELTTELVQFLNTHLGRRLHSVVRVLVRNLSSIIGRPNLIDRLWNDTIDLAEIQIRGSAVINELRRSCHHALGKRTLDIARAYVAYLDLGSTRELEALGFEPARADEEARGLPAPREILGRVVTDLEELLGMSEVLGRMREWQEAYDAALLRCAFGHLLPAQVDALVTEGIVADNRWVYLHHLRSLQGKADELTWPQGVGAAFRTELDALAACPPGSDGFDPAAAEQRVRAAADAFTVAVRSAHRDPLFQRQEALFGCFERRAWTETFAHTRQIRLQLRELSEHPGVAEQRLYLLQLDCLLEEMGYLALRHVATRYKEEGVHLDDCLSIIRTCALNLRLDGLSSRALEDLASLVVDPTMSAEEVLNALDSIVRAYHKIRSRVVLPYERLAERFGLDADDLRIIQANLQRYMHDLNSMVSFTDIAQAHIRAQLALGQPAIRPRPKQATDPWAILHISHRDVIEECIGREPPDVRNLYGGKGSGLLYISHLKVPTRDGFIVPTTVPRNGLHNSERLDTELARHLEILEQDIDAVQRIPKRFGNPDCPLLLAVRGGSVFSMPGILSTVVFVGMNDAIAEGLAQATPWTAYDSYRRFLASFAAALWGVNLEELGLVEDTKRRYGVQYKRDLPWQAMREITEATKTALQAQGYGDELERFLGDPMQQLAATVRAVFNSWNTDTSRRYREIKGLAHSWHTAAIVQEMAFGNRRVERIEPGMDERTVSLTGVIPRTHPTDRGVRAFRGEFKFTAAGDDLVAGVTSSASLRPIGQLNELAPLLETRLKHIVARLRRYMGTDQEVEFTVEQGVLSVLQSRTAETSADQATDRFHDPGEPATRGLGIRGGGFRGLVAFDDQDLRELSEGIDGRDDVDGVLMMLENPTPDDIPMIISADALLTAKGGSTSHAAVAIHGIEDRPYWAVMSAAGLRVSSRRGQAVVMDAGGRVVHRIAKGDVLSIHGTSGEVYLGTRRVARPT